VNNFPSLQSVTGTVSVTGVATAANQPALNPDGGSLAHITNFPPVQAISGAVSIGNFPATQTVGGSVSVSNLPATQPVSGTVSVGNFPATQTVSGTINVGASVGFGSAGSPSSSVGTVQGINGGTPLGISVADGGDTTLGSKADAVWVSGSGSMVSILKSIATAGSAPLPAQTTTQKDIGAVEQYGQWYINTASATPIAGNASMVATGGTAVNALSVGPAHGCQVINPLAATDQNISTAEPLYINIVGPAAVAANGSTAALAPGQSFQCVPGQLSATSINAATSGHKFTVFAW
jgi:Tfp pilus assembly protein PilW